MFLEELMKKRLDWLCRLSCWMNVHGDVRSRDNRNLYRHPERLQDGILQRHHTANRAVSEVDKSAGVGVNGL